MIVLLRRKFNPKLLLATSALILYTYCGQAAQVTVSAGGGRDAPYMSSNDLQGQLSVTHTGDIATGSTATANWNVSAGPRTYSGSFSGTAFVSDVSTSQSGSYTRSESSIKPDVIYDFDRPHKYVYQMTSSGSIEELSGTLAVTVASSLWVNSDSYSSLLLVSKNSGSTASNNSISGEGYVRAGTISVLGQGLVQTNGYNGGYSSKADISSSFSVTFIPFKTFEPLQHISNPGLNTEKLVAPLRSAIEQFRIAVLSQPGSPTFEITSGYRDLAYQQHFYDINLRFRALEQIDGIRKKLSSGVKPRPILEFEEDAHILVSQYYSPRVAEVNNEIANLHLLKPNSRGYPAVNPPAASLHNFGLAADIEITGISEGLITTLAEDAGLYRPHQGDDVHYQLIAPPEGAGPPSTSIHGSNSTEFVIAANSPVSLLLTDPEGRKIGFDPSTQTNVNEFMGLSEFSNDSNFTRYIYLDQGQARNGEYTVSGIGDGDGSYTLTMYAADDNGLLFSEVIDSGSITSGGYIGGFTFNVAGVPEPSSLVILGIGLMLFNSRR